MADDSGVALAERRPARTSAGMVKLSILVSPVHYDEMLARAGGRNRLPPRLVDELIGDGLAIRRARDAAASAAIAQAAGGR